MITKQEAARELLRRRSCKTLVGFAQAVDVPGRPIGDETEAWLFNPVESPLAFHHKVILQKVEDTIRQPNGRLMIFAPPGSAKSSYASVVAPSWACGTFPGYRVILASYAQNIAEKQSKRARQICRSPKFVSAMKASIPKGMEAAATWGLTNEAEFMATGILGAVTGTRADLLIIDDPVAGREEADSETMRNKTWDAYLDDLCTRLKPGASVIIIQTRWHEDDLSGRILPADYDGRSGLVDCRDGRTWEVLNIAAKCERTDDPLGREIGEYMWPEWFTADHWRTFENNPNPQAQRTWSALFQQRPTADTGGQFERPWFDNHRYDQRQLPKPERMHIFGSSDWAVTEKTTADYTEHGVWGLCDDGYLWALDWDGGQIKTDEGVFKFCGLSDRWQPVVWAGETGKDENAVQPWRDRVVMERATRGTGHVVAVELLPHIGDKVAKVASFRAMASMGRVRFPRDAVWAERVIQQLCKFPVAAHDDKVDVCGLAGRMVDKLWKTKPQTYAERPRFLSETRAEEVFDLQGLYSNRSSGASRI